MNKQTYEQITERLIAKITEAGVPKNCIICEFGNKNLRADIAIMAENYQTPVAIFEIKVGDKKQLFNSGIHNLKRIVSTLKITVKCYLVCAKDTGDIEIFDVGNIVYGQDNINLGNLDVYKITKLPAFSILQSNLPEKNDAMIEARKQEYEKILRKLCFWYIPAYCIIFLILDAFDIFRLTYERLIVHGAIIVITILPFVSELSMAGLRLKLREPEKEKKND